jgi:DNA-binding transcriptional ArsR family regulator
LTEFATSPIFGVLTIVSNAAKESLEMTLDLTSVSPIAGENAMRIREILRKSNGAFPQDWLSDRFGYSPQRARGLATALEKAGYVERDRNREERHDSTVPWYSVTLAGLSVAHATGAKRIHRETAEKVLWEFMDRIHFVNANPRYLYSVRSAAVFGSYLQSQEKLGDVDVAVNVQPRIPIDKEGRWVEIFRKHAWDSKHRLLTFDAELDWPRKEVLLALKARKRSLSLQSWFSFVEMCKDPSFQFRLLLGDEEEIGRERLRIGT